MAKYKALRTIYETEDRPVFVKGNIYDGDYKPFNFTVSQLHDRYPEDWQLVEVEENESTDEFKDIYQSLLNMQRAKDAKYGNSALKPLDIFAKHHNYGSRLDEKLARIKHSDELRKNDVADLIGGLVLICKDKSWTNFDDLID
ncbi:MAG: hypothetical protein ACLFMO_08340 [Eubacteriales bacterium]